LKRCVETRMPVCIARPEEAIVHMGPYRTVQGYREAHQRTRADSLCDSYTAGDRRDQTGKEEQVFSFPMMCLAALQAGGGVW
jgi:hypothetical protein